MKNTEINDLLKKNAGEQIADHFPDVRKVILLTRYACYLIAQNGDSLKMPDK
jgi:DNA-damage-inducible protein D